MIQIARGWAATAAVFGAIGVAMGAFAAHGASDPQAAQWLRTGGEYLLIHAIAALLALKLLPGRAGVSSGALFIVGGGIFAGTLAVMALGGPRWLGAVTPIGGSALILGWLALAWGLMRARPHR